MYLTKLFIIIHNILYMALSESLVITIITIAVALLGYILKLSFLSKCDKCNLCCGLISVHRQTNQELINIPSMSNPATSPDPEQEHIP